jgi:serine O-acetyltransferase
MDQICEVAAAREARTKRGDYGRRLLSALHAHAECCGRGGLTGRMGRIYWAAAHRFWSLVTQCEIHLGSSIGRGLILTHPNGVVIHPRAVIGRNCLFMQQVTIGMNRGGVPVVGDGVEIGPGAKVLGPIRIGEHAVIGANAVVIADVPDCAVVVGAPGRIVRIEPQRAHRFTASRPDDPPARRESADEHADQR